MKFLPGNLKFVFILGLLCWSLPFANAQISEITEQSVLSLEQEAKSLANQWNGLALRRSIDLYSQAAKKWKKLNNPKQVSTCLHAIALLEIMHGNYQASLNSLGQSLKIETANKLTSEKSQTLSLLSLAYLKLGKTRQSQTLLEQAANLNKAIDSLVSQARFNSTAAEFYYAQGDFSKAIDFYQKSLDLWRKTGDVRNEAQILIDYGYVFMTLGEPITGLNLVKQAEKKFQEINDQRGVAISQIAIGHLYTSMHKKQLALESYLKAKNSFPEDIDLIEKARLFNGIGSIYEDYNEWNLSLAYRQTALQMFKRGEYIYGQLATLPNLIKLSFLTGNPSSASLYFSDLRLLSSKAGNSYFLAYAYRFMGDYFFENKSNSEALKFYNNSLQTMEKVGFKDSISIIYDKLGMIYEREGKFSLARKYYNSSLEVSSRIMNRFAESNTLYNLARLNKLEENNFGALKLAKESLKITESLYSDVFNSKLKSTYFSNIFERYELYINLLMKMHRQFPNDWYFLEALQASEKSRARLMSENLQLADAEFVKGADSQTFNREKEIRILLNSKSDKLTDLLSRNAEKAEVDKLDLEIRELENELEEIKARLKQSSPLYAAIKDPTPFDAAEFQSKILDDNSLLFEFSLGREESYLWVISKNEINSFVLPSRQQIESRVMNLRELIEARGIRPGESIENYQARIAESEKLYWQEARILSDELFGQVSHKIAGKRLLIVADGKLHFFPVSALPFPNSERGEPILFTNEVIYEPSASMLSILARSKNNSSTASKNLLIFSDPVFSNEDSRFFAEYKPAEKPNRETTAFGSFRFVESLNSLTRLPASKDETDLIVNIIGSSKSDVFSGFSASREQLLNLNVSDYKILHFATHGLVDEERPELSGIVLSRYAQSGQKINEFVRLQDIYGMNLNADLVVLSACKTGIGKEVKGEGLMSLNNAFLQTGAKSVLSSLWKVDDNATKELMKNFYQGLSSGNLTTSEALRRAQIKLSQNPQYKFPFYWAAFTLQGDFQNSPQIKNFAFEIYYLLLLIIPALIFWIYRLWLKRNYSTAKS